MAGRRRGVVNHLPPPNQNPVLVIFLRVCVFWIFSELNIWFGSSAGMMRPSAFFERIRAEVVIEMVGAVLRLHERVLKQFARAVVAQSLCQANTLSE